MRKMEGDRVLGHDVGHLLGRFAGGVERGEDGAHAGAGDDVDGDVMLLHPGERADFGHGERAAATHGDADDGAMFGQVRRRNGGVQRALFESGGAGGLFACAGGLGGGLGVLAGFIRVVWAVLLADACGVGCFAAGLLLGSGLSGALRGLCGGFGLTRTPATERERRIAPRRCSERMG